MSKVHFVYIGNFEPPHSTENEIRMAIEDAGHLVTCVQENQQKGAAFPTAAIGARHLQEEDNEVVLLWTRTGWDWPSLGIETAKAHDMQREMMNFCDEIDVPTVGYHLDRWWGLSREHLLFEEPFFRVDLLCTADGGHREQFESIGVNHVWFPPAISRFETLSGYFNKDYFADVAFVGNHTHGYHAEWTHRRDLVHWLQRRCPYDVRFWPVPGEHAVRGEALRSLYHSARVIIGDSCLVPKPDGSPMTHYCSDRVPETIGRGGFLIHPEVEGITMGLDAMVLDGYDLVTYPIGDFDALGELIGHYVHADRARLEIAEEGRQTIKTGHTYTHRVQRLVELLEERNLL